MSRVLIIAAFLAVTAAILINPAMPAVRADTGNDSLPLAATPQACSWGWTITGYYLPQQSDFDNFEDFMSAVVMQGSGQLDDGTFIDFNGYLQPHPKTTMGVPVKEGMVAFDPNYFPFGTTFWINGQRYVGTDTGAAIIGDHLDVYTGIGKDAEQRAYNVTAFNQYVCWAAPR